jgi:hypothetical protein
MTNSPSRITHFAEPLPYFRIIPDVINFTARFNILSGLMRVLSSVSPCTVPPLNDNTPFYYYYAFNKSAKRRLIHISIGTWESSCAIQKSLLKHLRPIYSNYLGLHNKTNLDSYGRPPSSGSCARYTFNLYPKDGYTDYHVDPISDAHPFQLLALLNDPCDHFLAIKDSTGNPILIKKGLYNIGDLLYFDPSYYHAVLSPELDCEEVVHHIDSLRSLVSDYRVDCAYVNLTKSQTTAYLHRQHLC